MTECPHCGTYLTPNDIVANNSLSTTDAVAHECSHCNAVLGLTSDDVV